MYHFRKLACMQTIRLLTDETINQIAAGEVIESPASVVKELVENALDADAQKITVEVVGGGLQTIVIADDGKGMNPDDAKMSIVRHATSKIEKAQDLFHIASKGFRGEALASIASISKMTIETSQGDAAVRIEVERGEIVKEGRCARTRGTTVTVRNLFHNVPARKKFQKSPPALSAEILRLMTMLSLSHPSVQFELISNGKKAIQTRSGETLVDRAKALLGDVFASEAFPLDFQEESLHFQGLIGSPSQSRPNRMAQYLFLNKRAVSCDVISDAIRKGYGTRLEERRHPLFLLHIDVPPDLVDVNVHPQKLHVRLRKEELFRDKICEAVERAFGEVPAASMQFEPVPMRFDEAPLLFKEELTEQEPYLSIEELAVEVVDHFGKFLILKERELLSILDIESASFRILFEELLVESSTEVPKQGLLVPFNVDLTPPESAMVLTHQAAIEEMGFSLKAIGKDVFMVEALPPFLKESEVEGLLSDLAHTLQEFIGKVDYEKERREKLALKIAMRAKSKSVSSLEEGRRLVERLSKCENKAHCPRGNKVRIDFNHDSIERLFTANQDPARILN